MKKIEKRITTSGAMPSKLTRTLSAAQLLAVNGGAPRDVATGQSSGKRQHGMVKIT